MHPPSPARTVRLHLVNGTWNGIVCANSSRSALAIRAPRSRLKELCAREEAGRKGVYVLSGQDPASPDRRLVYVGESDCLRLRLPHQERSFDFFDHTVIATGKDDSFSKDHFRFVESELLRLAGRAARVGLRNSNSPGFDRLSSIDRLEAEDFLRELLLLLPILGLDIFRALDRAEPETEIPTFETSVSGVHALARETDDGFIVLAESTARIQESSTFPEAMRELRQRLVREGKLVAESAGLYRFKTDYSFSSPSAAATLVAGRSASGPQEWKVRGTDQSYRAWRENAFGT